MADCEKDRQDVRVLATESSVAIAAEAPAGNIINLRCDPEGAVLMAPLRHTRDSVSAVAEGPILEEVAASLRRIEQLLERIAGDMARMVHLQAKIEVGVPHILDEAMASLLAAIRSGVAIQL